MSRWSFIRARAGKSWILQFSSGETCVNRASFYAALYLTEVSESVKVQWGKMIERYLHKSRQLKAVFLLVDIRHAPSENDRTMYDWILSNGYHPIIIATKLDKINRSQIQKQLKLIRTTLHTEEGAVLIPFSAESKQGREEIYEILDGILEGEQGGEHEEVQ